MHDALALAVDVLAGFPHERIPDGTVWTTHHAIYGLLGALVPIAVCWDDYPHVEPVAEAVGVLAGLFGFLFVWPHYPQIGATLALAGPLGALLALLWPRSIWWTHYPREEHALTVAGLGVGLDDVVEHALPVPSPLDIAWAILGPRSAAVVAVVGVIGAVALLVRVQRRERTADTEGED